MNSKLWIILIVVGFLVGLAIDLGRAPRAVYGPCWITEQERSRGELKRYESADKPTLRAGFASGITLKGEPFIVGGVLNVYPGSCLLGRRKR